MTSQSSDFRFREIFDTNIAAIEAYCRRRLSPDLVADAVSETFLVAWRRLDDVPTAPETRLWLFGVARRVVSNTHRSINRSERLHLKLVNEHQPTTQASDQNAGGSYDDVVIDALTTLSDDDQELLRLLVWEELSHGEIATLLDISTNTVGVRVHRARERLAAVLDAVASAPVGQSSASSEQSVQLPNAQLPNAQLPNALTPKEENPR